MSKIVCYGEVLWDIFPSKQTIGGAPLNVAIRSRLFDNEVVLISAVGHDELGHEIIEYLKAKDIELSCLQVLDDYKTGVVKVVLDKNGSASYSIEHPSAWDKIVFNETSKDMVSRSDAFIFGSLASRDQISRETLYKLFANRLF